MDPAGARQGWIKQGLVVLPFTALPDALMCSDLSRELPLAAQNPEILNGKENPKYAARTFMSF